MGLMEAMSSGVPVVSTAVGMAPDLIADGRTGWLVTSEDVDDLVIKSLKSANADQDELAVVRDAAREAVMVCDWSVVGRRHLQEVYTPLQ